MTLIVMNLLFSMMFLTLSHPLSLGITLLIQTILISMISGSFCFTYWFSYILFLVMIGGMLILFIYMTSIASNEKFMFSLKSTSPVMIMVLLLVPSYFMMNDLSINNDMLSFTPNNLTISMIKYTYMPMNMILTFVITYLFIALIAIVKIIGNTNGPLRAKT
uniref:NADH-ubiquinone oxidoreductase chain 6 n=1 Tax=Meloidae sp. MT-2010 TaxID=861242 RepID=E2IFX6_9CUCU|nr:NADH dehydrogenase subunit 6 [Meloidae sp. MT-2010]